MRGSRTEKEQLPRIVRIGHGSDEEFGPSTEVQDSAKGPNTGVHPRIETSSMTPIEA